MPNGIDLILADHRRVDELYASFEATNDPTVVGQVLDSLTAHDDAEHAALYPLAGELLGGEAQIEELAAAHSMVKKQMEHLRNLEGPALTAEVDVLRQLVQRHVADEEGRLLPALAEAATPQQLEALGAQILRTKQRVG